MLDELKEEEIVNKVGGRFKLSTLIQKRMVALNTGAKPLIDTRSNDHMSIVLQEILQDKIFLDASGNLQESRNETISANLPAAFMHQMNHYAAPPVVEEPEITGGDA